MKMEGNMSEQVKLLDCTLRDGAYIVNSRFGVQAIKGIIKKLQDANIDIIECGWLKNNEHEEGSSFFHTPDDISQYLLKKSEYATYVAMIDWDRYDLDFLPQYDGKSIDAIRVVFPHEKYREGIDVGRKIREKGYKVFLQAANTLAYSEDELIDLANRVNQSGAIGLSVVDTFGAMFSEDLEWIVRILDKELRNDINLGFHSHNNQQLSFALSMQFISLLKEMHRACIVDASLCGMGRGAGNTTTELIANYINKKHSGNYDINMIMDAIDTYMIHFVERYQWGYSTPYMIAGMYCTHVNNIAYLLENHRTCAKDMRNIIWSMSEAERQKYDYDLLESKYIDYQNKVVNDEDVLAELKNALKGRTVLLIAPGKSILVQKEKVNQYIKEYHPIVIGINAVSPEYEYDYLFFSNKVRYQYAKEIYYPFFSKVKRIIASNIKTLPKENELIVNYNLIIKRGWEHFDNSTITCLRLMNKLHVNEVALAGFDGFSNEYAESYADTSLPSLNPGNKWDELNEEIKEMFDDFKVTTAKTMNIYFVTDSKYDERETAL